MDNALVPIRNLHKGDKYLPSMIVKQIYDAIDNPRDMAYLMYHIETGIRVSDVVNSEWVHIDWDNHRTFTYDVKKDSWRYIYWPAKVKPKLQMWRLEMQNKGIKSKYIFPFSERTANRIIKQWALCVGFKFADQVSSHWCRHTFIRLSRNMGRDIKAVQQNTGDTIRTLLDWYSTPSQEEMQHQIENISISD